MAYQEHLEALIRHPSRRGRTRKRKARKRYPKPDLAALEQELATMLNPCGLTLRTGTFRRHHGQLSHHWMIDDLRGISSNCTPRRR
jgi:hypothetical protein